MLPQSYLEIEGDHAIFNGNLDIDTLGGAGFASQRTRGENLCWDLSSYDGIELQVALKHSDNNIYTFILKDEISSNGEVKSTLSWEYDFQPSKSSPFSDRDLVAFRFQWSDLKPTYRGREKKDARPLKVDSIKRMSIMIRRYEFFSITKKFLLSHRIT